MCDFTVKVYGGRTRLLGMFSLLIWFWNKLVCSCLLRKTRMAWLCSVISFICVCSLKSASANVACVCERDLHPPSHTLMFIMVTYGCTR